MCVGMSPYIWFCLGEHGAFDVRVRNKYARTGNRETIVAPLWRRQDERRKGKLTRFARTNFIIRTRIHRGPRVMEARTRDGVCAEKPS